MTRLLLPLVLVPCLLASAVQAEASSSGHPSETQTGSQPSSSSSGTPAAQVLESTSKARIAQPEAGGSAITLETSEPLFNLAVALNACGYDADLAASNPVRLLIRQEVNDELQSSAPARDARDAVCTYIREHTLADKGLDLAQYVSLALYTLPPPSLTTSVGITELPPDAAQIVNILPLLRTFSEQLHLHALWVEHIPAYQAITDRVHDPLTRSILNTNIYLRLPVSSYDGRRFLVLLEPMLAPSSTNARIYASDYIAVGSPSGIDGAIHMDQVRHIYLQYMIEPLIYARAAAMDRLLPLLKPVQSAPIDFIYKSDITALITECLIRAVEARTLTFDFPRPVRPTTAERSAQFKYDGDLAAYDKKTETLRRELVDKDMRQGWALTAYFYDQLVLTEHDSASLKEDIGQMVYGMDVDRERKRESQIAFLPEGANSGIRRASQPITGVRLAELKLMKGDLAEAEDIAQKTLDDPRGDHPEAHYVLGQVNILQSSPDEAIEHFGEAIKTSKNPRTLAWSHIYLGRLYDTQSEPDRTKAIAEYKAALTVRDSAPDTKAAAEKGIKAPFSGPKRTQKSADEDDAPFDPSGKAEKEAYRPSAPQ
jgi:tetratricopeptide (TPR) repeat protein